MEKKLVAYMKQHRVIGSVRTSDFFTAKQVAGAMLTGGIKVFEVSLSISGWAEIFKRLQTDTEIVVGAGAVTNVKQAYAAVEKGARFISTPGVIPNLIRAIKNEKVMSIVGAFTPTEVYQAMDAGADIVEIFPAANSGGPVYLSRLKSNFPEVDFIASGGVEIKDFCDYLDNGASMVVVGEDIARQEWLNNRDFNSVISASTQVVAAARSYNSENSD
ncbi:MAG TPA: hypothetical protein PLN69_11695 [bacterium]|nr:hypothetical protein [bacterium]